MSEHGLVELGYHAGQQEELAQVIVVLHEFIELDPSPEAVDSFIFHPDVVD